MLDDAWDEMALSSPFVYATERVTIGGLGANEAQFNFVGQLQHLQLGTRLRDGGMLADFRDTPVAVMNVSDMIHILDQYATDRAWIQQAVQRLRVELREEMDLNCKLVELGGAESSFLLQKVSQFMTDYRDEISSTENELTQILADLQRYITENRRLMDTNHKLRDDILAQDAEGVNRRILNIRALIDRSVDLLNENNRWGDTNDRAWKFAPGGAVD